MSERILAATVKMINEQSGIHGVNMRSVAKTAGCAHTNVYNYFESFDNLLWKAFELILENWVKYTKDRLSVCKPDKLFAEFIAAQIDFALSNGGWYRFIWLEPFTQTAPETVMIRFHTMQANFASLILSAAGGKFTKARAEKNEEIIHGYLHGELCKLISMRFFSCDSELHKKRIIANCRLLLDRLS